MTGLENILNGIKNDSDIAAQGILKAAEDKAAALIAEAEAEAEKILKREAEKSAVDAEEVLKRAKSSGELSAKKIYLSEKQKLIAEVIDNAKKKLKSLEGREYFEVLESIISKNLRNEEGKVIFSKADSENMPEEFTEFLKKSKLSVSEENLPAAEKGCIIVYSNADENCTFDELFEAYSETISDKAQEFLFD